MPFANSKISLDRLPPLSAIRAEIARREDDRLAYDRSQRNRFLRGQHQSLLEFIRYFWDVLEPVTKFVEGWVSEAICEHLEAVTDGRITRLLINVPPGFSKSLTVNVFWPAWEWATLGAHVRYVSFSYASHLTERDNEKFRDLIMSVKFKALYGDQFRLVKAGAQKVQSDKTGWKFASSVDGVGTGERGDRVLLDDPHNVKQAESDTVRRGTVQWFRESMSNRLNDLATGVIIVIMQRVHSEDISGTILDNYPDYVHFCVPMEFEETRRCHTSIGWVDPREYDGELAWPEKYPARTLLSFKRMEYLWAGQYQQIPIPRGGGIIKRDYWRMWDREAQIVNDVKPGTYPPFDYIIAYFDGAFGQKQENDFSAMTVIGTWVETTESQRALQQFGLPCAMVIEAWRKKLTLHGQTDLSMLAGETKEEYAERRQRGWGVVEHVAATCKKRKVDRLIIEAKANGIDVGTEMRRLYSRENWMVILDDPGQSDKIARAYAQEPFFANGRIWGPGIADGTMFVDWMEEVVRECELFPKGPHDDFVDCIVGSLRFMRRAGLLVMSDESSAAIEEMLFPSEPPKNLIRYER